MLSMRRRRAITMATATTAVLALSGTALPLSVAADSDPDLSRFYRQKISWSSCRSEGVPTDLQCGKVTVPLDYARPAAGTLDLALAR
ncbi:MAG: alpha/beta hydrolase, partial [Streptomyces sp.]|nr:alpha/beta hydrolase [Streptomyces sp.]